MQYSELIEKKRHGTPYFPVEYYYIDNNHPRYVMSLHWHKEFEIIRVTSGRLTVYLNNAVYDLDAGDCLFIEGGCLKRGYPKDCVYECLVFDTAMLDGRMGGGADKSFFEIKGNNIKYKNFIDRENTQLHSTIDELLRATREAKPYYELETVGLFYQLFYRMYTSGHIVKSLNAASNKGIHMIIALLEWIELHSSERITLSEISKVTGLSEKYICRIFKEYTSKTIIDYINESRIEKACTKIRSSTVTQTAFDCGFNDLSYFCKTFKKYVGMSPSKYKKGLLEQDCGNP